MKMIRIEVTDRDGRQHTLEASPGASLMETLRDADMGIEAICGGQCACATCHCYLEANWFQKLDPAGEDERDLIGYLDAFDEARSRLTCQIEVTDALDGLELVVAPEE